MCSLRNFGVHQKLNWALDYTNQFYCNTKLQVNNIDG